MTGTLYGLGVGPGDPELLTLKAHRLLQACPVIAYPAPDDGKSFARSIVAAFIPRGVTEICMTVPMRVVRFPAQTVYDDSAAEIAEHLMAGRDVAVLCEGDPFFYGSFMYLYHRLAERFACEIVPGVSSLGACAAALGRPLTARNDVLTVLPGPLSDDDLRVRIAASDAVAIMKVGRHLPRLRALLDDMQLTSQAGYIERASLQEQRVTALSHAPEQAPYFSMVLIYKGDEDWVENWPLPTKDHT